MNASIKSPPPDPELDTVTLTMTRAEARDLAHVCGRDFTVTDCLRKKGELRGDTVARVKKVLGDVWTVIDKAGI